MGLFSFTQEIAMDLGTANTIILNNGKIVVDEPSVVALDRRTDKMIAVGERAKMMYEKENPNIRTVRPLRDGVIADFNACEQMMRGLIKKVNMGNRFFSPSLRMVIGVPSGSTEVELRAVRDSAEHAGGRDVYLIFEPMAAAIGIGIDVEAPEGNMIVDIGGGSTEIAVISLGGIVSNNSIRIAGDDLTDELITELEEKLPSLPANMTGCMLPLMVKFLGKPLKHGKVHKIQILRLWRTGKAMMEQRWMDERCYVTEGETVAMNSYFIDENLNGIHAWTQKHNNYANREIVAAYEGYWNDSVSGGNGLESRNKEKGKYYKLPKFLRAFMYFFVRYICFGGFLDGKPGFIWATLQAYWYRYLIDAKIEEMEYYMGKNPTPQEMRTYFKEQRIKEKLGWMSPVEYRLTHLAA